MARRIRLTPAQIRWLNAPGKFIYEHTDRTFNALRDKGVVEIVNRHYQGSGRQEYALTALGRRLLKEPK